MTERAVWALTVLALVGVAFWRRSPPPSGESNLRPRPQPGVRLSMNALHQQGGVPLGWQLTPPPGDVDAGRRTFEELGCPSCHRVAGEPLAGATDAAIGPELTGMGTHHPAGYFLEAILNPDAVLIDAPGYVGDDGHSVMPSYPDMTVGQLADLVAYLGSLTQGGGAQSCHVGGPGPMGATPIMSRIDYRDRPKPSATAARSFFAQTYDVLPGRLDAFEAWFATDGKRQLLAAEGLVDVETYVDLSRPTGAVTTLFAFRDEAALRNFMADPGNTTLWQQLDGFVGPHGHHASDGPLVYRAPSLSTE